MGGSMGVWDYGIITGTVACLFFLVYYIIKIQSSDSFKREVRAKEREDYLLDVNEKMGTIIERHSHALKGYSEILNRQSVLIEKQSDVLSAISTRVESISGAVDKLNTEVQYIKKDVEYIRSKSM